MKSSYSYDHPYNNFLLKLFAVFIWEVNMYQCLVHIRQALSKLFTPSSPFLPHLRTRVLDSYWMKRIWVMCSSTNQHSVCEATLELVLS